MFDKANMEFVAKLGKKLNLLQKKIGDLKADGRNNFAKWDFISSNQIKSHLNRFLPEVGLICIPSVDESSEVEAGKSKEGNTIIRTTVRMSFLIIDTETGYSIQSKFSGADQDVSKSFAQAVTDCNKRFWFNLLSISEKNEDQDNKTVSYVAKEDIEKESSSKVKIKEIYKKSTLTKEETDEVFKKYKEIWGDYKTWNDKAFVFFAEECKVDKKELSFYDVSESFAKG